MNSAEPHGSGCGAAVSGHIEKGPVSGIPAQGPFPPAQFWNPEAINCTPMSMTVGPVTIGGKTVWSHFGGMNDNPISRKAQTIAVPMIAPFEKTPPY